ncbi:MAG: FMN-binding protein [Deltaproteobacteria bacterium]|nr:FMN-binding protein [Deltaproteobacteria bacterium]MBW2398201.1 FMN-binding protein [Deltaproteobacteria bacterium]MBW2666313.1 FMN-binding protein [Deltaproteobacteria bacterium]
MPSRGFALLVLLVFAAPASATVYHSRSEALELAFPGADRVDTRTYILNDEQVAMIRQASRGEVESKLVKVYTGMRGDEVLGYAFIDTHTVRTMPEAFMVVLTPNGVVRSLRILAFYEPREYQPNNRWYAQFEHKTAGQSLRVGGDIHGIAGATLSARATTRGVRRALAFYEILVASEI